MTPLVKNYFRTTKDTDRINEAMLVLHSSGRLGIPADVANLVSWFASDEAAWVTGQEYPVDGGRLARR